MSNPDQVPESAQPEESLEDLYEEFRRTFQHRPGVNFVETLRANGEEHLLQWLHPSTNESEPRAFVRLIVDATRGGVKVWEQPSLESFREGGPPTEDTRKAFATLARYLGFPIIIFFDDPEQGVRKSLRFEP